MSPPRSGRHPAEVITRIAETVRYAERLGGRSMPRVPSLALGSGEVTLLAMTSAFGAFANAGMLATPTLIRRVTTRTGAVSYEARLHADRAVSSATAYLMTSMLADVVNSGTAWEATKAASAPVRDATAPAAAADRGRRRRSGDSGRASSASGGRRPEGREEVGSNCNRRALFVMHGPRHG